MSEEHKEMAASQERGEQNLSGKKQGTSQSNNDKASYWSSVMDQLNKDAMKAYKEQMMWHRGQVGKSVVWFRYRISELTCSFTCPERERRSDYLRQSERREQWNGER